MAEETTIAHSVALATGKGGVGKTMLTAALSASWAKQGMNVLAVDCDPQASATMTLGVDPAAAGAGRQFAEAVQFGDPLAAVPSPNRPGLSVVPAGIHLRNLVTWLASTPDGNSRFAAAFASAAEQYDRILFDLPPSVAGSRLAETVLSCARFVLAPCTDQISDIEGLRVLGDILDVVESDALILGVVLVRVSVSATRARRDAIERIAEVLGGKDDVFDAAVRSAPTAWRMSQEDGMLPAEASAVAEAAGVDLRARIEGHQKAWPKNLSALADDLESVASEADAKIRFAEERLAELSLR